jgi:hypothetical protein
MAKLELAKYSGMLSEAIDEGLGALGQLPMRVIYEKLETGFNMRKIDIPSRFDEFSRILRDAMGPSAEPILEFIIDRFYNELGVDSKQYADLDEYITRVCTILTTCKP